MTGLLGLYVHASPQQRAALERFFGNVRNLKVQIDRPEVAVAGDDAVVSFIRVDDFTDVPSGRPQHVSVRLTKALRRVDGRWRFAGGR